MASTLIAFPAALAAYLAIDVLASRWSGEQQFSLPIGCVVVGVICVVVAHFVAPWAAAVVFTLLAAMRLREAWLDRRSRNAIHAGRAPESGP
ncbi:MAG: hypothetical protein AB7Q97_26185 [Gammaproteobacteria bacterium]